MHLRGRGGEPLVVAIAGPNGAGKTTFFHAHVQPAGLRFVNADNLASSLELDPYVAARMADALRRELIRRRESFAFETVFSDPKGEKLEFLKDAAGTGYAVILCFIGLSRPTLSEERVAMRVSQGGHDVPSDKLLSRFPRVLANLRTAIRTLPQVRVFDNSDLVRPFQHVATCLEGKLVFAPKPVPSWLEPLLKQL